eukprot:g3397.t1
MLPFDQARDFTQRLALRSQKEWCQWSKSGQRPCNVPSSPERVYKGKGWVSYPDWMGYKTKGTKAIGDQMLPFQRARDVVRALKMTSQAEWKEWSKSGQRPSNVPSSPDRVYKGKGWVSYPDWMGYKTKDAKAIGDQMLPFQRARDAVRALKMTSQEEWKEWSKSGQRPSNVPSSPHKVYKGKGWVSWPDWMGYKPKDTKAISDQMLPFERARDAVRALKMTSQKKWREWKKSGQRPSNVPSSPDRVYKGKGWVSYPDWMGYKTKDAKAIGDQMLPFQRARDAVRALKMTSQEEWKEWSKSGQRPSNVPSSPHKVYKGKGWVSWPDWMGYKPKNTKAISDQMLPFERARDAVRALKMTSLKEWFEWSNSGQRPCNVPSNPHRFYKGKGWVSYPDWMGYKPKDTKAISNQMLPFQQARDAV